MEMLARTATQMVHHARKQGTSKSFTRAFGHRVNMVLKEDVKNLGNRGDEVRVKAGYARNFLYPEKKAVYATESNRAKFKVDKESVDEAAAEKERQLQQIMQRISSVNLVFKRHTATKSDRTLHTSVTAENISDMLEKQHGIIVGVARVQLPTPIKTLGSHTVKIRVDEEIEKEYEALQTSEDFAAATKAEESSKKGPSKKKEVKLNLTIIRR